MCGIYDRASDERVGGSKQLGEVTRAHLEGWNRQQTSRAHRRAGLEKVVLDPFLSPVEEDLFLIGVEFPGDVERAAEVVPKLVVFHGRHIRCARISVARPSVGVKRVIPEVFVSGAVEVLRAGLSDDANLRPGRAAILRGVVRGQDLYLLCGVNVRSPQASAVGARAGSLSTVVGNQILRVARAVKISRTLTESERQAGRRSTARSEERRVGKECRSRWSPYH